MGKELVATLIFSIDAMRLTKHGGLKLTLNISEQEAAKALAIAIQTEAVFSADIFLQDNQVFGSKSA